MIKPIKTLILLFVLTFTHILLQAQDTIVKIDNERIICKIKEISTDEIKYLLYNNDILMAIDKNDVSKVILSNGTVMNFSNTLTGPEYYKNQRKNDIKVRLFSPLYGFTEFSFEHSLRPGSSFELSFGFIGLGRKIESDPNGFSVKLGYKFIQNPDFYIKGIRYAHVLKGFYLRPEIAISVYREADIDYFIIAINNHGRFNNIAVAAILNIGKQWVFNDFLALDLFAGLGYGYSNHKNFNVQYGFTTASIEFPIALSSGFRLGFLF